MKMMQTSPTIVTTPSDLQPLNGEITHQKGGNDKENKRRTSRVRSQPLERKKKSTMNRVPDENQNLEDTVFGINTSFLLVMIGLLKLFLIVPLFVLGMILVSMKSSGKQELLSTEDSSTPEDTTTLPTSHANPTPRTDTGTTLLANDTRLFYQGNDSMAPLWTAAVLALSGGMDFFASFGRQANTIVGYMLASTFAFVSCILCIEYDRLEINNISSLPIDDEFLNLHYNLYLSCIVFASIGVAIGLLSIVVGTRMAALEQLRLYMERDGLKAVLHTNTGMIPRAMATIRRKLSLSFPEGEDLMESTTDAESLSGTNETIKEKRNKAKRSGSY